MKNLTHLIIAALFATVISIFATTTTMAQDPVKVDAKHYKVEVENAHVRVLRVNYGAKEKSVMHQHPAGVAISLTDTHGKFALSDGRPRIGILRLERSGGFQRKSICLKV